MTSVSAPVSVSETTCIANTLDVAQDAIYAAEADLGNASDDVRDAERTARAAAIILASREADYDAARAALRGVVFNSANYDSNCEADYEAEYNSTRDTIHNAFLAVIAAYNGVYAAARNTRSATSALAECECKYDDARSAAFAFAGREGEYDDARRVRDAAVLPHANAITTTPALLL